MLAELGRDGVRRRILLLLIAVLAALSLHRGWSAFWFLTDDAHIAFRYVSNSVLGHGFVWNAAPFLPVEGYTSFLWVAVLDVVWRLCGVEPPRSSNLLSLLFAGGTLLLVGSMVGRLRLRTELVRWRLALLALVLAGCLANRTFLAWTSSGLETAMFNFFYTLWIYAFLVLGRPERAGSWALRMLAAAFLTLSRPDGLLFLAATGALWLVWCLRRLHERKLRGRDVGAVVPALLAIAHLLWRRSFYGEWLPNTYVAKYVAPWPESGVRYLLSFVLEYALWVWGLVVLAAFARGALGSSTRRLESTVRRRRLVSWREGVVPAAVVATVLGHIGYYTFVIGGDHFEYRVYSQLVPLLMVAFVWALNRVPLGAPAALVVFALWLGLAAPLPWIHYVRSQQHTRRLVHLRVPVADALPGAVRWYGEWFDQMQFWLINRSVCMRHQEHKLYYEDQARTTPLRKIGLKIPADGYPVIASGHPGVIGWRLPTVNIIDTLGLNDYVIARTPVAPTSPHRLMRFPVRQMAHQREAPEGYVDAYQPNVEIRKRIAQIGKRRRELSAEAIRSLELEWRERIAEIREEWAARGRRGAD